MRHIPDEVLDRIIEACDDEHALVSLSFVSKQLRIRVASQQETWHARFELHFTQRDHNEQKWLHQYRRESQARARLNGAASKMPGLRKDPYIDWFGAYCKRRAIEYRWRQGQYVAHRLDIASTHPCGIRLQSIPHTSKRSPASKACVASQWLRAPQQQPEWFLEQLNWGDTGMEHTEIQEAWFSLFEYLV
ncbi:hypothetical protein THASP1DRAFT_33228 [Thamnocephalis sphaerospora]|uniref:F-box domain-containing protein n=1 Tax=Thamnocephalis sphaerospora TaxID=78915 RepID=A0A4V1IVR2_9FUNG|nr:hypothetical protein THASP1DRAFT_33228 [Thamnocephalis sphaerospora]|eukprot:RKP04949.1 hypothetical protein THASP1DRAFT_33228 [Thamnocephalis sphaerospora]